ncbi:hypothetical protein [Solidesulfovibrio sp.]
MASRYPAHVCKLPGCNVVTTNRLYCCKACSDAAQVVDRTQGTRTCANCHAIKPAADFVHAHPGGGLRLRSWCSKCRGMLSDTAQARRTATIRARAEQRREARAVSHVSDDRSPAIVDAKGRRPEVLSNDLRLGHPADPVPGNSIQGAPFGA